jgi:hypothetical protein
VSESAIGATSTENWFGSSFVSCEAADGSMHGGDAGAISAFGKDHTAPKGLAEWPEAALGDENGAELAGGAVGDAEGERCVCICEVVLISSRLCDRQH